MKTDDLIGMLARGAGPVEAPDDGRRLVLGLPLAFLLALALVTLVLGLVPPALWPQSATLVKIGYAAALGASGLWLLRRIGRPGMSVAVPLGLVVAVLVVAATTGLVSLFQMPDGARAMAVMGKSAARCPVAITVLSIPALLVCLRAAQSLAPVNRRLAGAAAGLAAGGLAAAAYGLACDEGALAFVAVWYSLGMGIASGIGALAGPVALRW